jgi:hypothetical protein
MVNKVDEKNLLITSSSGGSTTEKNPTDIKVDKLAAQAIENTAFPSPENNPFPETTPKFVPEEHHKPALNILDYKEEDLEGLTYKELKAHLASLDDIDGTPGLDYGKLAKLQVAIVAHMEKRETEEWNFFPEFTSRNDTLARFFAKISSQPNTKTWQELTPEFTNKVDDFEQKWGPLDKTTQHQEAWNKFKDKVTTAPKQMLFPNDNDDERKKVFLEFGLRFLEVLQLRLDKVLETKSQEAKTPFAAHLTPSKMITILDVNVFWMFVSRDGFKKIGNLRFESGLDISPTTDKLIEPLRVVQVIKKSLVMKYVARQPNNFKFSMP